MSCPAEGELLSLLAAIPDPRGRQGLRHPIAAMLAAILCGILSGARGCAAISPWIRHQKPEFWHLLGFRRKPPTTNCYRDLLLAIPAETLENAIRAWVSPLLEGSQEPLQGLALDGKTLCGTLQPHGASVHLLSLLDHATLGEDACRMKTGDGPHNLAALRNAGLTAMRLAGYKGTASAIRDFAAKPVELLKFLTKLKN